MIKTNATFESQHRYIKELQQDLDEMAYEGLPIPETVEVSPAVFITMCYEANLQGARELRVAVGRPVVYCDPALYSALYPNLKTPCIVRVVPK